MSLRPNYCCLKCGFKMYKPNIKCFSCGYKPVDLVDLSESSILSKILKKEEFLTNCKEKKIYKNKFKVSIIKKDKIIESPEFDNIEDFTVWLEENED